MSDANAPLTGIRVIEVAGLGPAPFGCTILADLGADVIRVDRAGDTAWPPDDPMLRRGRRSIALDLKRADHLDVLLRLADGADVFVEGFRPGVAERLGCGPDVLTSRNPRLVYARMTGWGQTGPMADLAGHDINYISVAGVLGALGDADRPPPPPLNVVGDFGGGGMFLAVGVLAALQGRSRTGRGDVLDVSMLEGASYLLGPIASIVARGGWSPQRHSNGLDGGAPFYGAYECADGRFVSIGPLEPQFYARLLAGLGLDDIDVSRQWDRSTWPELRRRITGAFLSRPRDHWTEVFVAVDACVAPVLALDELTTFPHVRERGSWVEIDGLDQPTPTPRFERSTVPTPTPAPRQGAHTQEILAEIGLGGLAGT